ncbi:MlaD family protein [Patulibacter sp.]|uniref:MlaD family protein n=1 Tax=Patulibacter sp. TaxID=1912859 RepID=UPI002724E3F7|nr:MlaD family protein [Patulibacter sp.]MDO9410014.1 MlaD family protein [Patulibacter sp.]
MSRTSRRVVALLVGAVLTVAVVLVLGRGTDYRVVAAFEDAGQLVPGNEVRVGGAVVGSVERIRVGRSGLAELELRVDDDDLLPLHRGTVAVLRNPSLSSVAGRIVALQPGPNDAPEIRSGGRIEAVDTRSAVDIDQVVATFDVQGRRYLRGALRGGASTFDGIAAPMRRLLRELSPALRETDLTLDGLARDEPALRRLLTSTAVVADTLAGSRDDLGRGLESAAATLRAIADEREALTRTLRRAPAVTDRTGATLRRVETLVRDARPLLRDTRPVAPRLASTVRVVGPLADDLPPLLADVRATVPPLTDVLRRTPLLADRSVPAVQELTAALTALRPIVPALRAYTPDVVAGLATSFGGRAAGYYDANGHYGRIGIGVNADALPALLRPLGAGVDLLAPVLGTGIATTQTGVTRRCPGAATQTAADGSNPWAAGAGTACTPTVPSGGAAAARTGTRR